MTHAAPAETVVIAADLGQPVRPIDSLLSAILGLNGLKKKLSFQINLIYMRKKRWRKSFFTVHIVLYQQNWIPEGGW